jgi:hypothetical protein
LSLSPWARQPNTGLRSAAATRCSAHEVIVRPTQDIDLFTDQEHGVEAAADTARRLDPGLTGRGFADAGRQLDRMDDEAFARYGLTATDVSALRERFAAWPRTAEAADRQL